MTAHPTYCWRTPLSIRLGRSGFCTLDDCAVTIVCTVVSDAVAGQVVLDGGTKTFASDRCGPAPNSGHGYILKYPDAMISKLTEEHGQVDVSGCERRPQVGERVTVIPNHICPFINLQDAVCWREIDGRLRPAFLTAGSAAVPGGAQEP